MIRFITKTIRTLDRAMKLLLAGSGFAMFLMYAFSKLELSDAWSGFWLMAFVLGFAGLGFLFVRIIGNIFSLEHNVRVF